MSLKPRMTALILAALLAAPVMVAAPAMAAGQPSTRAECRLMDPDNRTPFCRELHEIDVWRQQIMDDTGPTPQKPQHPILVLI